MNPTVNAQPNRNPGRRAARKRLLQRLAGTAALAAALVGCAAPVQRGGDLGGLRQGPGNTPQRNVTDFSAALRCMDDTMYTFGVRDVSMLIEDLRDESRRLGAGTRDMMVSAISEMTRRSRAVRLVTFGNDHQNIQILLQQLESRTPFGILPQYDIRGSITQFDEDVVRRDSSVGISGALSQLIGFNVRNTKQINVLGFDASVVTVPDLTLIPGVTSKNTVIVARDEGSVGNGVATIQKVGVNFNMSVSQNAGVAQALRNMIELSAVELVGKVTRVPYWTCLGMAPGDVNIKREIEDWYFSMRSDAERNKFFQEHLRNRKFYDGPVDGKSYPALTQALSSYKRGLGFAPVAAIDESFFTAFLTRPIPAPPSEPFATGPLEPPAPTGNAAAGAAGAAAINAASGNVASASGSTGTAGTSASSASAGTSGSAVSADATGSAASAGASFAAPGTNGTVTATAAATATAGNKVPTAKATRMVVVAPIRSSYKPNENIEFAVQANHSGYLYCYSQRSDTDPIQRIFPNRSVRDPRIEADQLMLLPGAQGFKLPAEGSGSQKIACLVAPREVYNDLPPPLRWGDFEDIRLKSFNDIRVAFEKAGKFPVVMDVATIQVSR